MAHTPLRHALLHAPAETECREQSTSTPQLELFRETQAAKLLNVSVKTLQRWRCEGVGPRFVKVGARAVRYVRADLITFIQGSTRID